MPPRSALDARSATGQAIVRMSTGERVAQYICRLIFDGELPSGSRVPQDEIAQTLGVSRIPVREALIALEREGWVRNELHRGAFISPLDRRSVQDHYDLFGVLYGFGATRAIERTDHAQLGADLARLATKLRTNDTASFGKAAVAFHRMVIDAAQSPRLATVMRSLSSLVPGDFFELVPKARTIERVGMPPIATAIRQGDAALARQHYASMMAEVGQQVVILFAARGLFESRPA